MAKQRKRVQLDREERELALRRYDVVIKYYIYENTVYWTRNQFFAAINAGLLALVATRYDKNGGIEFIVISGIGFIFSLFWLTILHSVDIWIDRWHNICVALELEAFEHIEVFRNCPSVRWGPIKVLAKAVALIFVFVWVGAISYSIFSNVQPLGLGE